MRNSIFILLTFILLSCKSKPVETNVPDFDIQPLAMIQDWVAGQEMGGKGTYFFVIFKKALPEGVLLKKVNFDNRVGYFDTENGLHFQANLIDGTYDLQADPKMEANNQPPSLSVNEQKAILHFTYNGKPFTLKSTNIKRKPIMAYPSMKGKPNRSNN